MSLPARRLTAALSGLLAFCNVSLSLFYLERIRIKAHDRIPCLGTERKAGRSQNW
jgi:hypothetical protein